VYKDKIVSIIMPAYNAECYVSEAIESVLEQTYPYWEMLVVDDCSSDSTYEIISDYSRKENRIKALRSVDNSGPAGARNLALRSATGRYVAFLDSDDLWLPSKLERQLEFMERNACAFSYTEYRRINDINTITGRRIKVPKKMSYHDLLKHTAIATSTVLLDRVSIGEFSMAKVYYDDFVLWLELLKRGYFAYGLSEDLMRYRVLSGSVSRNKIKSSIKVWHIYRDIEKLGILYSVWCFLHYTARGYLKYRVF